MTRLLGDPNQDSYWTSSKFQRSFILIHWYLTSSPLKSLKLKSSVYCPYVLYTTTYNAWEKIKSEITTTQIFPVLLESYFQWRTLQLDRKIAPAEDQITFNKQEKYANNISSANDIKKILRKSLPKGRLRHIWNRLTPHTPSNTGTSQVLHIPSQLNGEAWAVETKSNKRDQSYASLATSSKLLEFTKKD